MTREALLKKQLEIAIHALEEIDSRRVFGPGMAEIALEKIRKMDREENGSKAGYAS